VRAHFFDLQNQNYLVKRGSIPYQPAILRNAAASTTGN
jgi:hypothetical protein